jgi:beta-galactosidase
MAEWQQPSGAGTLRAIGFRGGGEPVAEAIVEPTGPAVALGLEIHPSAAAMENIPADGEFALPVTVFAIDARGRRVPTADVTARFELDGPGRVIGVGNGDPTSHEPDKAMRRTLFRGLAQVIVQTTTAPGAVRLAASAAGLAPASLTFETRPAPLRPSVPPARRRHFVTDWRMSPITRERPDPRQQSIEQDMNTWERVEPGTPQPAWRQRGGYALYRATFTPPRAVQARGGEILFHGIGGEAEVFVNGSATDAHRAPLGAGSGPVTISVVVRAGGAAAPAPAAPAPAPAPAGLTGRVEVVAVPGGCATS